MDKPWRSIGFRELLKEQRSYFVGRLIGFPILAILCVGGAVAAYLRRNEISNWETALAVGIVTSLICVALAYASFREAQYRHFTNKTLFPNDRYTR
jgi:hypothetical protein